ncbi:hypothetical protein HMPREF2767_01375 [Nosocomiicoccus sp. HMSC067E10]|uniref:IS1096 element passenger TnpR family protein n=1 Tax=Nosocomiicoccus sp. HMSC067E10 TaxID=1739271 RepID=UPI0008A5E13D|nr:hypothetical protein [Nosocomiicoccus sp. HMSC067E10]OFL49101.1 hypothetical protein HMPREF2767_01375 [Nosocomiicoccus sp. HMSC067E10]
MDLRAFFKTYYKDDMLYRALIWYNTEFSTVDDFVEFKLQKLNNGEEIQTLSHALSMAEVKLVERLKMENEGQDIIYVEESEELLPLKEFQYIIDTSEGSVTHFDIIKKIYDTLLSEDLISDVKMMLDDSDIETPSDIYKLTPIYTGNILWLYDNLTSRHLRDIIRKLNITHYGSYKDSFIETVVNYLTTKEYISHALSLLPNETVLQLKENAEKNIHVYDNKTMWQEAKSLGILVQVHRDYLVMHEGVLNTLKDVDISSITSVDESKYFNGYELLLVIDQIPSITRNVIIPTRLSGRELIEIIKESFIWNNNGSYISFNGQKFYENGDGIDASFIQVDAMLKAHPMFTFHYKSEELYKVNVSLIKTVTTEHYAPRVISHSGETPIDNVGDIDKVKSMLEILSRPDHIDYNVVYERARTRNYRERYPITAINAHIAKIIHQERPYYEKRKD